MILTAVARLGTVLGDFWLCILMNWINYVHNFKSYLDTTTKKAAVWCSCVLFMSVSCCLSYR